MLLGLMHDTREDSITLSHRVLVLLHETPLAAHLPVQWMCLADVCLGSIEIGVVRHGQARVQDLQQRRGLDPDYPATREG